MAELEARALDGIGTSLDEELVVRRRPEIESAFLPDGSCLLYDPVSNEGHALNAAGALIWDYCDGTVRAGAIADELATLLSGEPQARLQALSMIAQLLRLELVAALPDPGGKSTQCAD